MLLIKFCFILWSFLSVSGLSDIDAWLNDLSNQKNDEQSDQNFQSDCDTDAGEKGACVKLSECEQDGKSIDTTTAFNPRISNCHYLMICCAEKSIRKITKPEGGTNGGGDKKIDCGYTNPGGYIFRNDKLSTYAEFGEFRWMVAVLSSMSSAGQFDSATQYYGGGSLIHPSVVLTSAYIIQKYKAEDIKCRAGEWDTRTENENNEHQERFVRRIIVHYKYNKDHLQNNAALLMLKEQFDLTKSPHIGIACLGTELPRAGTQCFSMGWGKNKFQGNEYANILKKVSLPLVGKSQCEDTLRKTRLGPRYYVHDSLTCAGGKIGEDTCEGDGGSSLVCPIDVNGQTARYAVYGMVAYGIGCGDALPAVYVNVPNIYDWVVGILTAESIDVSSFKA